MSAILDGPRRMPASGRADALVVLVHGYGANGEDLIALADHWRAHLPNAAFVAPNAPEPLPFAGFGGFQWFALTTRSPDERWAGTQKAAPALQHFISVELQRLGLGAQRLALVGFSQGTMLSLHVGLRMSPSPAAILGYSGIIAGPEHLGQARAGRAPGDQPQILLVHGEEDDVIPADALPLTTNALAAAGLASSWHLSPELGHGIDMQGLELGGRFLQQVLGQPA
ncbi:MAG: dienelactone hydrolase family protein [Hyphomicrobiaceae bacterium]|nr:dienelactone hydrolase family protein [Hyphomicrobiaceae bacterium]MCC0008361.1 dienelactone hydrolase family protein [Hyphomicrobiaceae bacterium]